MPKSNAVLLEKVLHSVKEADFDPRNAGARSRRPRSGFKLLIHGMLCSGVKAAGG